MDVVVALTLIAAGLVLALGFPGVELLIFEGRPLGVLLTIVGALDLLWALFGRDGRSRR